MIGPTKRQMDVMKFIYTFRATHGGSPTTREISAGTGKTSTNGVHCHLSALYRKGLLSSLFTGAERAPRSIRLTEAGLLHLSREPGFSGVQNEITVNVSDSVMDMLCTLATDGHDGAETESDVVRVLLDKLAADFHKIGRAHV